MAARYADHAGAVPVLSSRAPAGKHIRSSFADVGLVGAAGPSRQHRRASRRQGRAGLRRGARPAVGGKLRQTLTPARELPVEPRFLLLSDVAAELNVSDSQVYHMVRSGELPAIKVGGRGQWRVERSQLEKYIADKYAETAQWVRDNPLLEREPE